MSSQHTTGVSAVYQHSCAGLRESLYVVACVSGLPAKEFLRLPAIKNSFHQDVARIYLPIALRGRSWSDNLMGSSLIR
jgi:hypothetical protein